MEAKSGEWMSDVDLICYAVSLKEEGSSERKRPSASLHYPCTAALPTDLTALLKG